MMRECAAGVIGMIASKTGAYQVSIQFTIEASVDRGLSRKSKDSLGLAKKNALDLRIVMARSIDAKKIPNRMEGIPIDSVWEWSPDPGRGRFRARGFP